MSQFQLGFRTGRGVFLVSLGNEAALLAHLLRYTERIGPVEAKRPEGLQDERSHLRVRLHFLVTLIAAAVRVYFIAVRVIAFIGSAALAF